MKNFVLILVLMTINGCAVQQMSGGASNPSSPSSSGGMPSQSTPSSPPTSGGTSMPSPSLPSGSQSGSQSSESGSQSSESGSQSSESGSQSSESGSSSSTSGSESIGDNQSSESAGNASSNQGEDSQSGSGVMSSDLGSGQSASSIFDKSLGDFDKEMAEEREVIAAANQDRKGIMSEEIADAVAVNEGYATEGFGNQGIDKIDQSEKGSPSETSKQIDKAREDMPSGYSVDKKENVLDVNGLIVDEDEVAKQIREAAERELDAEIRAALWEEWEKYIRRTK